MKTGRTNDQKGPEQFVNMTDKDRVTANVINLCPLYNPYLTFYYGVKKWIVRPMKKDSR